MKHSHVLIFPSDGTGCGLYRLAWPGYAVYQTGKPVNVMPRAPQIVVDPLGKIHGINVGSANVVVFQRPGSHQYSQVIPILQSQGIKVIIDMDDSLSTIHPRNSAFKTYDPRINHKTNWMHAARACEMADWVTVTTAALAEEYGSHGRVTVIPNHVPESYLKIQRPDNEVPVIGWAGWTNTHVDDLRVTSGMINQVLVDTGAKFAAFGDEKIFFDLGIRRRPPHEHWGFTSVREYPKRLVGMDIGLVPLQNNKFNQAKCLDGSTRIATRRGILRLETVELGDFVWNDGHWRQVEAINKELATTGFLVTTKSGRQLKLTREHRLWSGGWKEAADLREGDMVSLASDEFGACAIQSAPWPSESRASRKADANHFAFIDAPDVPRVRITERWARFLGLFAGDGCSSSGGQSGAITISCDGQDQDLIDLIMDDLRQMGMSPSTESIRTYEGTVIRRRSVGVRSATLLRVLISLGVSDHKRKRVCVPEVIWNSPREVVVAYLAGLFEADGSAAGATVVLTMKQKEFILDIQRLLVAFGIESFVSERWNSAVKGGVKRPYWSLRLRRAGSDIFEKEIGFLSERKKARLAAITCKPHSNAYMPQTWTDSIVNIEPCWLEPVDLQVEGSVFAAAGFVSHNSWLKGLEMASLGIVPVVTPLGDYQNLIDMGAALPASNPKEWYTTVRELVLDSEYRQEMSKKVRSIAADWSIEQNWSKWWHTWNNA